MKSNQNFDEKIKCVKSMLQREMILVNKGKSEKSLLQLEYILAEVKNMETLEDCSDYNPSYPRIIVDSWDFTDKLGKSLLELDSIYKNIKK